ncbi:MAG: NAD-dependent epimerase/dehydratase family protein [Planctomycetota bacterium]
MAASRLIFGCGYLGKRVADRWAARGDQVTAVTRSPQTAESFRKGGLAPLVADVTQPATLTGLPAVETLLFAVGYDRSGEATISEVYADGFRSVLDALPGEPRRIVYISTTGVYGGAGGGDVDEATPPAPTRPGGVASLAAEQALRASRFAGCGVALRLAGIYGPGRVPLQRQIAAGEPIAAPAAGHVNLIHVDDAADVVVAAADAPGDLPPVLCVSDGAPPLRRDYYGEAARLLGAPAPEFVTPAEGSPRAARAAADKRVRNDLMKQVLGVSLRYPNYGSGLAAILGKQGPEE